MARNVASFLVYTVDDTEGASIKARKANQIWIIYTD